MITKVILGATGLICSELINQLISDNIVLAVRRSGCTLYIDNNAYDYDSLVDAMNSILRISSSCQLIVSFRSRSWQSLDLAFNNIEQSINAIIAITGSSLKSVVFLNSVCSIINEPTQEIYYHLEKSMMSRLSKWYSTKKNIESSVDILLHNVPRDFPDLREYTSQLIGLIDLSAKGCISGSQILFYASSINSYS